MMSRQNLRSFKDIQEFKIFPRSWQDIQDVKRECTNKVVENDKQSLLVYYFPQLYLYTRV